MIKTTHFLHTSTFYQVIQNKNILKPSKYVYYFLRIIQKTKAINFIEEITQIQNNVDTEVYKKYGQYMLQQYKTQDQTFDNKRESVAAMKHFMTQYLDKNLQSKKIFKMKEK